MNITELARILRITPNELREYLPQFGFDIGRKAIKINRNVANRIIKEWPKLRAKIEEQKMKKAEEEQAKLTQYQSDQEYHLPNYITVKDFSAQTGVPVNIILKELMKNGIFASLNERIDFETAWLVGQELGLKISKKEDGQEPAEIEDRLKDILDKEKKETLLDRPPVIVVMGHVDHGKTRLLDSIRETHVIDTEAGGITQHIGAYQVERKGQKLTFVDTPGHEAFTAMRGRGAKIADIAILVVAADDGVKPQTVEAFRIIEAAKIPFVVAVNKIDKPDANIEKTKQELTSKLNIVPEEWGGKAIIVPISAKENTGIDDLLDMVLLAAESEAGSIKANPDSEAVGTIIESHIDKGAGPVATILIQNGTLRIGDQLISGGIFMGKIRNLKNYLGESIKEAKPATPTQIIGLKALPEVGDILESGEGGERIKHKRMDRKNVGAVHETQTDDEKVKKINIIVKSDVLGSAEAIEESLAKINTKDIKTKIIHKGLGNITDGDLKRAEASDAKVIGFNVKILPAIEEIAREKNIDVKLYTIIYDLINDIKAEMKEMVVPVYERREIGRLKVLAIFRTEKKIQIVGGKVIEGQATKDSMVEVVRSGEIEAVGNIGSLQAGKQEVSSVEANQECGIEFLGDPIIQEGDILQFYKDVEVEAETGL
jgi:translation initiation factor IF-2